LGRVNREQRRVESRPVNNAADERVGGAQRALDRVGAARSTRRVTATAAALDRIAASIPPKHLLPNDPTIVTLALRLGEFSDGLRKLTTALVVDHADQMLMRDLLYLAENPALR
jgi:hypothetical protein